MLQPNHLSHDKCPMHITNLTPFTPVNFTFHFLSPPSEILSLLHFLSFLWSGLPEPHPGLSLLSIVLHFHPKIQITKLIKFHHLQKYTNQTPSNLQTTNTNPIKSTAKTNTNPTNTFGARRGKPDRDPHLSPSLWLMLWLGN